MQKYTIIGKFQIKKLFTSVILPLSILFLVWYGLGHFKLVKEVMISSPEKVLFSIIQLFTTDKILPHLWASTQAFSIGLFSAIFLGISLGTILGLHKTLQQFTKTYVAILNGLPLIAAIPLIILWFGVGIPSKIIIVFLISFTPILINTIDGTRNTNPELKRMARSFKASTLFMLKNIIIFEALPFIFSGIKIAVGRAIIGVIIAEAIGYGKGIGYLLYMYSGTYQTANFFAIIILILFINILFAETIKLIEKNVLYWKN